MGHRDRRIKLELTIPQAVALYYAAGSLRDDIICAADKTGNQPPVSGSRKSGEPDFCRGNRPHGPRKQRWGILVPLLMLVASHAFGSLGETPRQFEPRRADEVSQHGGGVTMIWRGKTVTHAGFFYHGYAIVESFWFNDHRVVTKRDWERFIAPYYRFRPGRDTVIGDDGKSWFPIVRPDGTRFGVVMYNERLNWLSIWRADTWDYFAKASGYTPRTQVEPQRATQPEKNDCMIVATENLHRLADASVWSNIVMFKYIVNGVPPRLGHAVAVWKITDDGKVFATDDDGTFELNTTSTDVLDILNALAVKYSTATRQRVFIDGHFAIEKK
jgi:hypothetical protein